MEHIKKIVRRFTCNGYQKRISEFLCDELIEDLENTEHSWYIDVSERCDYRYS